MSAPMKKRHISSAVLSFETREGDVYRIPMNVAKEYLVKKAAPKSVKAQTEYLPDERIDAASVFKDMDAKYTEVGALLRGTRNRENLSQKAFAKIIGVTQSDLSKMENGKRAIGKIIAKRIEKAFNVDYRYFLG